MQTYDSAPYLNQIFRALEGKTTEASQKEIGEEFENYLRYGVPPEQAVKTILRHHGVGQAAPAAPPTPVGRVPLAQLPPTSSAVHLKARVLSIAPKEVTVRGEAKEVLSGLLGDESGVAPFTSWRAMEGIQKGDVIEVVGAYTKEYRGSAQVNFGDRARLTKLEGDPMPSPPAEDFATTVAGIREGMRGIQVTGRILDVAPRQVTVQGQPRTVWGGTFADTTGHIEFTSWHDHQLAAGSAVTIQGAYARSFRNVPQLTFDLQAKVTPAEGVPPAESLKRSPSTPIGILVERGFANDVTVVGTLLEVRPGSGLIFRCPAPAEGKACGRVVTAGQCRLHGKQEGTPDLRVKAILDDGTGAVSVTMGREITERLLGLTLEEAKAQAQAAFRPDLAVEKLKERLTGRPFVVQGFARSDEYGLALIARNAAPYQEDVAAAAKALLEGGAL
ncbi:MAG: hypothetical protein ACYDBQ_12250 [Thermoplasmatota archaeon]